MIGVLARVLIAVLSSRFTNRKILAHMAKLKKEDLTVIGGLIQTGKVTPVIDRRYALTETAEAIRYLEQGHARGKVVVMTRPD
jgi:NADPH:quinone reductase-like Zn-dependent oxidoreductase